MPPNMMRAALLAQPDAQAVFAHSDEIALGAIAAIESAGRTGELLVCGVDAMPEALNAMRAGKLTRRPTWCRTRSAGWR